MKLTQRTRQNEGLSILGDLEKQLWRINWKQEGYPFCGIYAISPADNGWPTKIGISQNPVKRLDGLQTACWKRLEIREYRYAANFKEAKEIEQKVHADLSADGKSLHGEWFDIKAEKAIELVDFVAELRGIWVSLEIPDEKIGNILRCAGVRMSNDWILSLHDEIDAANRDCINWDKLA